MSFFQQYKEYAALNIEEFLEGVTAQQIKGILSKNQLTELDFLSLLSPVAEQYLEVMAQKAHKLTVQHFGRTIVLYTPIYLSNYCANKCVYCSFNSENEVSRKQLTLVEVEAEAEAVSKKGLEHVLLLTGDAPGRAFLDYLLQCIKIMQKSFSAIGLEVYALLKEQYRQLFESGADVLTIYQETYNPRLYESLHLQGPKRDYHFRLDAPERACQAGMRGVNIGALLGLDDWRRDTFFTGIHASFLQNKYTGTEISVSMPRIRPHLGEFQPQNIISDKHFVQCLLAYRLYLPRAGITISTRESAKFRDNIIRLGVTKMSAGSSTTVGGHTLEAGDRQFDVSDIRDVEQMKKAVEGLGYQAVMKDWEKI